MSPLRLLLLLMFALCALAGGGTLAAAAPSPMRETAEVEGSKTLEALRTRLKALEDALGGDVCVESDAGWALLGQSVPQAGAVARPAVEGAAAAKAKPVPSSDLARRLRQAVVLVIAGDASGSGFFVGSDVVATNKHVVDGALSADQTVVVIGSGSVGVRPATIIAADADGAGRDYALLKISGDWKDRVLPFAAPQGELQDVVAAGFPGLLLGTDAKFRKLAQGDLSAMPEPALSKGTIMAMQNQETGLPIIAHSAPISEGNSGGPLADDCGRIVGINTFINVSTEQARSAGFAIASGDLLSYLKRHNLGPAWETRACSR